jgi:hypothetical protein
VDDLHRVSLAVERESHVLLAATSSEGLALEPAAQGAFTRALLELFRDVDPTTLSYQDIIRRLTPLKKYEIA